MSRKICQNMLAAPDAYLVLQHATSINNNGHKTERSARLCALERRKGGQGAAGGPAGAGNR